MADFASRLRELRNSRGLRQKDLARELGLAQTTIANYEQKSRFPDEGILGRIADYFNTSLDYLLGRIDVNLSTQAAPLSSAGAGDDTEKLVPVTGLAREYLDTLLKGEREQAGKIVHEALERGKGLQEIYLDVFERSLKEVGRLWAEGRLDVAKEHFFTEATLSFMSQLSAQASPSARPKNGHSCLCLSVCGEQHLVGVRMITDLLELDGWNSYFLGGNICTQHVLKALADNRSELLVISVTLSEHLGYAMDLIQAVRANPAFQKVKILVGGQAVRREEKRWQAVGADATARDAAEAVRVAGRLLESRKT